MLYIDAASSSRHAGNYTCVARNRAGRADRTATLNVHGKTARRSLPKYQPPLPRLYIIRPVATRLYTYCFT